MHASKYMYVCMGTNTRTEGESGEGRGEGRGEGGRGRTYPGHQVIIAGGRNRRPAHGEARYLRHTLRRHIGEVLRQIGAGEGRDGGGDGDGDGDGERDGVDGKLSGSSVDRWYPLGLLGLLYSLGFLDSLIAYYMDATLCSWSVLSPQSKLSVT